ncbi:MAG: FG-GAP repeat domain-containing protein [Brevirhabdus sp.]
MRLGGALIASLIASVGAAAAEPRISDAHYSAPTTRYAHAVLGDDVEYGALVLSVTGGADVTIRLPQSRVFEDLAPRLADLDGDGTPEVITVESDARHGARLAVYDETGLVTATPFIGRAYRWLAPIGAADLDGDGKVEIAYIDRPHLARTIMVWRFDDDQLTLVGKQPGYTNHRIGENTIAGGIRDCGAGPEMIVTDTNWQTIQAVTFDGKAFAAKRIGPHKGRRSFHAALQC